MLSKGFISIEKNGVKVETVIEMTELVEGEYLNGSVYITTEDANDSEKIDFISLKVLCEQLNGVQNIIAKHSFQLVGNIHSKDAEIIPFEFMPDERWICQSNEHLVFKTKVVFLDNTEIEELGVISYHME